VPFSCVNGRSPHSLSCPVSLVISWGDYLTSLLTHYYSASIPHTNRFDCASTKLSRGRHILRQHILRSHVLSVRHGILGSQDRNSYPRLYIATIVLRYRIWIYHLKDKLVQGSHHIWICHLDPGSRSPNHVDAGLFAWTSHWDTGSQLYRCWVLSPV